MPRTLLPIFLFAILFISANGAQEFLAANGNFKFASSNDQWEDFRTKGPDHTGHKDHFSRGIEGIRFSPESGSGMPIVSLKNGNKWYYVSSSSYSSSEYKDGQYWQVVKKTKSKTIKTVIGDTVINNSNFKIIESIEFTENNKLNKNRGFWYSDSVKFAFYSDFFDNYFGQNLTPFYYLSFPRDTSWQQYFSDNKISVTNSITNLWGRNREVQAWSNAYRYFAGPSGSDSWATAIGIGPISYSSSADGRTGDYMYSSASTLIGAFIDGTLLGDSISVPVDLAPPTPAASVKSGNQAAVISWTKSQVSDFRDYRIYSVSPNYSFTLLDSTNSPDDTTLTVSNLENGKKYYFAVTTVDQAGHESDYSNTATAEPSLFSNITPFDKLGYLEQAYFTADYDNNGFPDIVVLSLSGSIKFYRNGSQGYAIDSTIGFPTLGGSSISWADYNNDGYFDFCLTGQDNNRDAVLRIYKNIAGQRLEKINTAGLQGLEFSSIDWADYDNNGTLDFIITGTTGDVSWGATKLYSNLGNDNFSEVKTGLPRVYLGNAEFGDFDNDGDQDLLISGHTFTKVYENINHTFKEFFSVSGYQQLSAWGDFNNDGFLDIVLISRTTEDDDTYWRTAHEGDLRILINNNGSGFKKLSNKRRVSEYSFIQCQDVDQNGSLDIITDKGVFRSDLQVLDSVNNARFQDIDNDGDLDRISDNSVYRNNIIFKEVETAKAPTVPEKLSYQMPDTNTVILKWRPSTDDTTPDSTISYAVRIGTRPGEADILSPLSNPVSGKRLVLKMGNAGFRTSKIIKNLPNGTYYWSVQALDNNFNSSIFAMEKSFKIDKQNFRPIQDSTDQELSSSNSLFQNYPNPFNAKTIIRYELLSEQQVSLKVYNIMGCEVATLVNEKQRPGVYRVNFDYPGLSSGVYIYKIVTDKMVITKKMLLIK